LTLTRTLFGELQIWARYDAEHAAGIEARFRADLPGEPTAGSQSVKRAAILHRRMVGDVDKTAVTVLAVIDADSLVDPEGPVTPHTRSELNGISVPVATISKLMCHHRTARIVRRLADHGRSEILDVGRASRLATTAQRRALAVRDAGCDVPGCTAPPSECDVHHLTPWSRGGATDLDDLGLVCDHHHWLCHHGWTLTRDTDGGWHFHPPP
jgi:hypothetical protein